MALPEGYLSRDTKPMSKSQSALLKIFKRTGELPKRIDFRWLCKLSDEDLHAVAEALDKKRKAARLPYTVRRAATITWSMVNDILEDRTECDQPAKKNEAPKKKKGNGNR